MIGKLQGNAGLAATTSAKQPAKSTAQQPAGPIQDDRLAEAGMKVIKLDPGKDYVTTQLDVSDNLDHMARMYMVQSPDGKPVDDKTMAAYMQQVDQLNGGHLKVTAVGLGALVGLSPTIKLPVSASPNDYGMLAAVNKAFGTNFTTDAIDGASSGYGLGGKKLGVILRLKNPGQQNQFSNYFVLQGKTPGTYEVMTQAAAEKRFPTIEARLDAFGSWPA